jgi:hypothetical protein
MAVRAKGSAQNLQLLSALTETLERSRQNRFETLSAITALRSHVSALASCSKITDESPQPSTAPSAFYNELLVSKYRDELKRMQEHACSTTARLSASEFRVQQLEVHYDAYVNSIYHYGIVVVSFHECAIMF